MLYCARDGFVKYNHIIARHCEYPFRTATKSKITLSQDITTGVIIIEANHCCPVIARYEAIQSILFPDCFVPRNDENLPVIKQL
jgi:hypothetical protein